MPRRARRRIIAALAVAALALVLAACGGGGGGGEDQTAGLTPQQILDKSAEAAKALETFHIDLALTGTADVGSVPGLPAGAAGLLNGPIDVSGAGPVEPPDKASIDARIVISGIPLQGNVTRVGDAIYLGVLNQDFKLDVPPSAVGLLDFGDLYPTLVSWTKDPQEAGREDVDGAPTVKITGTIDAAAAARDLAGTGAVPAGEAARAARALRGTVEAWVGTEDLRPRRVHLTLTGDGTGVVEGVGTIDLDLTATFSAFDEPVDIQAPADAQPLDPGNLGSLVGG